MMKCSWGISPLVNITICENFLVGEVSSDLPKYPSHRVSILCKQNYLFRILGIPAQHLQFLYRAFSRVGYVYNYYISPVHVLPNQELPILIPEKPCTYSSRYSRYPCQINISMLEKGYHIAAGCYLPNCIRKGIVQIIKRVKHQDLRWCRDIIKSCGLTQQ